MSIKKLLQQVEYDKDKHLDLGKAYFEQENYAEAKKHFKLFEESSGEEESSPITQFYLGRMSLLEEEPNYEHALFSLVEYREDQIENNENTDTVDKLFIDRFEPLLNPEKDSNTNSSWTQFKKERLKRSLLNEKNRRLLSAILGEIYFQRQDYVKARRYCEESSCVVSSCYYLGKIYFYGYGIEKKYNLVRDYLKVDTLEAYPDAYLMLGKTFEEGGHGIKKNNIKTAIAKYQKAESNYYEANYRLGCIYSEQEGYLDYNRAVTEFIESALSDEYRDFYPDVFYRIAKLYQQGGHGLKQDEQEYLQYMQQAVTDGYEPACKELIAYYEHSNNTEQREQYRIKWQELQEQKAPYVRGLAYAKQGKYPEAIKAFMIAIDQKEYKAYFELGKAYRKSQNYQEAAKYYKAAIPYNSFAHYCLAQVYSFNLNNFKLAAKSFDDYLKQPKITRSGNAHYYLGEMYKRGNENLAVDQAKAVDYYYQAAVAGHAKGYAGLVNMQTTLQASDNLELKVKACYLLAQVGKRLLQNQKLRESINPIDLDPARIKGLYQQAAELGCISAIYELGKLAQDEKQFTQAEEYWQKVVQSKAAQILQARAMLGLAQLRQHQMLKGSINTNQALIEKAIDLCKEAIYILGETSYECELTQANELLDTIKFHLMTSLLYEALRHHKELEKNKVGLDVKAKACLVHRRLLKKIAEKYADYSAVQYSQELRKAEENQHTFFGTNLSDDSDSDEESSFQKLSNPVKQSALIHSTSLFNKADLPQAKNKVREILNGTAYDIDKAILKPTYTIGKTSNSNAQIEKDLKELNYWRNQNNIAEGIKRTIAKFVIAQYRGIHYKVPAWNQAQRQRHRKQDEIGQPIFATAVHNAAKIDYAGVNEPTKREILFEHAAQLKQKLIALANTTPFLAEFKHNEVATNYEFPSSRHYLQDLHAKDWDKFHGKLRQNTQNIKEGKPPIIPGLDIPVLGEPFVSTGDIPLHALKYAYGIKPYVGHKHERLRPRWNKQGKAERPYSGKVYLSLHPINDYVKNGPFHMISENHLGHVRMDSARGEMILQERETSFPAEMAADRIVYTHVAKYPSFAGDYKDMYAVKYGIDRELYELFQKALAKYRPHSSGMERIKILMGEYLCHYHQIRLIEQAQFQAEQQDAVLVYLDEFGDLSLTLPSTPAKKGKDRENIRDIRNKRHREIEPNASSEDEQDIQQPVLKKQKLKFIH